MLLCLNCLIYTMGILLLLISLLCIDIVRIKYVSMGKALVRVPGKNHMAPKGFLFFLRSRE